MKKSEKITNIKDDLWDECINTPIDYAIRKEFYGCLTKIASEGNLNEFEKIAQVSEPYDFVADTGSLFIRHYEGSGSGGRSYPDKPLYNQGDTGYLNKGLEYFDIYDE